MSIVRAIKQEDVHRICSGQVITTLASAVKELVENALDSRPQSRIEVRLVNSGFDSFEVVDDGVGLAPEDRESVCLKHFTSKLASFEDLTAVQTFGFRGEALSSLCETAGGVVITTKHSSDDQAVKLAYDRTGRLVSSTPTARASCGTTVQVKQLFDLLPVRRMDLERKLKKHYTDLLLLLQAYAIITFGGTAAADDDCGRRIKFFVTNVDAKGVRSNPISTLGTSLAANLTAVFGSTYFQELVQVGFDIPLSSSSSSVTAAASIVGYVSKPQSKANNSDRQFFFLNGRPVELKRFAKAVSETWRLAGGGESSKPGCIVDLRLPPDGSFDVNLSPDKREIYIAHEADILSEFRQRLLALWAPSHSRMLEASSQAWTTAAAPTPPPRSTSRSSSNNDAGEDAQASGDVAEEEVVAAAAEEEVVAAAAEVEDEEEVFVEEDEEEEEPIVQSGVKRSRTVEEEEEEEQAASLPMPQTLPLHLPPRRTAAIVDRQDKAPAAAAVAAPSKKWKQSSILDFAFDPNKPATAPQPLAMMRSSASSSTCCDHAHHHVDVEDEDEEEEEDEREDAAPAAKPASAVSPPILIDDDDEAAPPPSSSFTLNLGSANDLLQAEQEWIARRRQARRDASLSSSSSSSTNSANAFLGANIASANEGGDGDGDGGSAAVEQVLEGTFLKSYFKQAEIIGQFNLGFIIARVKDDLFILDQHASDEKFRFETLQQSTTLHEQPLIAPLPFEASAVERQTIRDYEHVFHANGFHFLHRDDDEDGGGGGLMLTRVPHSKQTMFGIPDVRELAGLLRNNPPPSSSSSSSSSSYVMPRPSKLRAMFASRACRSAVMIGDALTAQQMSRIVSNLETLQQPWNCPHGRPTLRHLVHLPELQRE